MHTELMRGVYVEPFPLCKTAVNQTLPQSYCIAVREHWGREDVPGFAGSAQQPQHMQLVAQFMCQLEEWG